MDNTVIYCLKCLCGRILTILTMTGSSRYAALPRACLFLLHILLPIRLASTAAFGPHQGGCDAACVRAHLDAEVLLRARNKRCCGETLALRLGSLQKLSASDMFRQIDLGFGQKSIVTCEEPVQSGSSAKHTTFRVHDDVSLLRAIQSPLGSRLWLAFGGTTTQPNLSSSSNVRPLLEIFVTVDEWPSASIAMTMGADHLSDFVWNLASKKNGDALASVDLRYERLLRSDLSKQGVAIEIPRKPGVSQSQKLKKAKATALKPHLPLAGPGVPTSCCHRNRC